jgi:hypothetical protein
MFAATPRSLSLPPPAFVSTARAGFAHFQQEGLNRNLEKVKNGLRSVLPILLDAENAALVSPAACASQ